MNSLTSCAEDYFKSLFGFKKSEGYWKWFGGNLASGGAAGATSLLFVYSLDYARTRLANDAKSTKGGGARQFNGLVDVYKKTLATDGLAGLYRGFMPSVVGIIVYRGLYFGGYDSLSKRRVLIVRDGIWLSVTFCRACCPRWRLARLLLGLVLPWLGCDYGCWSCFVPSGHHSVCSFNLFIIAPIFIRCSRRMMMTSGAQVHYKGMMDAGSQIIAKEGVKSLFKGAGANILRGVAGAGVLSLYDKLQQIMFGRVYSGGMYRFNVQFKPFSDRSRTTFRIVNASKFMSVVLRSRSIVIFLILPASRFSPIDRLVISLLLVALVTVRSKILTAYVVYRNTQILTTHLATCVCVRRISVKSNEVRECTVGERLYAVSATTGSAFNPFSPVSSYSWLILYYYLAPCDVSGLVGLSCVHTLQLCQITTIQ